MFLGFLSIYNSNKNPRSGIVKLWWIHISLVETACKPFHEVIHYMVEISQDGNHYIVQIINVLQ
jgi:hypothetical protein